MFRFIMVLALLAPLAGCGGNADEAEPAGPMATAGGSSAPLVPSAPEIRVVSGEIARADMNAVIDAGLGRFLQGVGTEAQLDGGRFVGFTLTRLYPEDARFQRLDLRPGDVVVRVNGQPIERPEQALAVWNGLRVASELMVEYVRAGEPRQLRFDILD